MISGRKWFVIKENDTSYRGYQRRIDKDNFMPGMLTAIWISGRKTRQKITVDGPFFRGWYNLKQKEYTSNTNLWLIDSYVGFPSMQILIQRSQDGKLIFFYQNVQIVWSHRRYKKPFPVLTPRHDNTLKYFLC